MTRGAIALAALALLGGCRENAPSPSAPTATASVVTAPPATVVPVPSSTTRPAEVSQRAATLDALGTDVVVAPLAVRIDDVDISAPVVPVGADPADGELAVPPTPEAAAWYEHGPTPGADGAAVLAAHVDWNGARGPFFALAAVPIGAEVVVNMADGRELHFVVRNREQVRKADLPVERIFAREGPPRLVLITCGGDFDRGRREYADNVVLFADPVEP